MKELGALLACAGVLLVLGTLIYWGFVVHPISGLLALGVALVSVGSILMDS